jgi:hypothetical protein
MKARIGRLTTADTPYQIANAATNARSLRSTR